MSPSDLNAIVDRYDSCLVWGYNPKTRTLTTVVKNRRPDGHLEITREVQTGVLLLPEIQ